MKRIEETQKENSRALLVIQDDEGFDWSEFLPVDDAFGFALLAQIHQQKEPTEEEIYIRRQLIAQTMKTKIYNTWKEAKKARRWDTNRECYLDPKGNIVVEPSSVNVETLIKSIAEEEEEQRKIDEAKKVEEERLKSKKINDGIIDTTMEMNAENMKIMADKVHMTKALEVDSKFASSSKSSNKVSNSGSNNGSGKTDSAKTESDCQNCMKECKVCSTYAYLTIKRTQELVEKADMVEKQVLSRNKMLKASSERIKELTEKI
ncbi:hypothetical protein Hanom_Chr17g01573191 [Helianthus anomalus]